MLSPPCQPRSSSVMGHGRGWVWKERERERERGWEWDGGPARSHRTESWQDGRWLGPIRAASRCLASLWVRGTLCHMNHNPINHWCKYRMERGTWFLCLNRHTQLDKDKHKHEVMSNSSSVSLPDAKFKTFSWIGCKTTTFTALNLFYCITKFLKGGVMVQFLLNGPEYILCGSAAVSINPKKYCVHSISVNKRNKWCRLTNISITLFLLNEKLTYCVVVLI